MFRNDLIKKGLLHRLTRLKEMVAVRGADAETDSNAISSGLDASMQFSVDTLSQYDPPPLSIPINADIRTFDWKSLGERQFETTGRYYDVIMMDPPWQLATANHTRGVCSGWSVFSGRGNK